MCYGVIQDTELKRKAGLTLCGREAYRGGNSWAQCWMVYGRFTQIYISDSVFGAMLIHSLNVVLKLQACAKQYPSHYSFDDVYYIATSYLF